MNDIWNTLCIDPTDDLTQIKQAYARLIKQFRPETSPKEFRAIRDAYEKILASLNNDQDIISESVGLDDNPDEPGLSHTETEFHEGEISDATSKERLMDLIYETYKNIDTRNDLDAWKTIFNEHYLSIGEDQEFGCWVLDNIIKCQFLYKPQLLMDPIIYIFIFDFFRISEKKFLEDYTQEISDCLLKKMQDKRDELRLEDLKPSPLNHHNPVLQLQGEKFLIEILNLDFQILYEKLGDFRLSLAEKSRRERSVYRCIAFKFLLDSYLNTNNLDSELAGALYIIYEIKSYRRYFIKVLTQLEYSPAEIKNCLDYYESNFKQTGLNKTHADQSMGQSNSRTATSWMIYVCIFVAWAFFKKSGLS